MTLNDYEYLSQSLISNDLMGSDTALANLFLLQPKYNIQTEIVDGIFLRKYFGKENRYGYGFPLELKCCIKNPDYLKSALEILLQREDELTFCLCTQTQKFVLNQVFQKNFSQYKIEWNSNRDDSDYVYLQKDLTDLRGNILQKKKNHISRFSKFYGNQYELKLFPENDIRNDILKVAEEWFIERNGNLEESLIIEKDCIKTALENESILKLTGAVLYVNQKPIAMTLASPISENVLDIHFEKALGEYAKNGAYAVINNLFAKKNDKYLFINREEDMGIEGLRKAKLSYRPEIILDKFYGKVINVK